MPASHLFNGFEGDEKTFHFAAFVIAAERPVLRGALPGMEMGEDEFYGNAFASRRGRLCDLPALLTEVVTGDAS